MGEVRADDVARFTAAFADQPDLETLTGSARRLLATAAALFLHDGAAGTSVRDITGACGLSPGALYNHFGSKDDLLHTIVRHGHDRLRRRLDECLSGAACEPAAQLAAFVEGYVLGHLEQPELAQVARRDYLHLSPGRRDEIVALRRGVREELVTVLRTGQRTGAFDLIGGSGGAVRQAVMVLDLCSRPSEWFRPSRRSDPRRLGAQYVTAALRLVGAAAPA